MIQAFEPDIGRNNKTNGTLKWNNCVWLINNPSHPLFKSKKFQLLTCDFNMHERRNSRISRKWINTKLKVPWTQDKKMDPKKKRKKFSTRLTFNFFFFFFKYLVLSDNEFTTCREGKFPTYHKLTHHATSLQSTANYKASCTVTRNLPSFIKVKTWKACKMLITHRHV